MGWPLRNGAQNKRVFGGQLHLPDGPKDKMLPSALVPALDLHRTPNLLGVHDALQRRRPTPSSQEADRGAGKPGRLGANTIPLPGPGAYLSRFGRKKRLAGFPGHGRRQAMPPAMVQQDPTLRASTIHYADGHAGMCNAAENESSTALKQETRCQLRGLRRKVQS